MKKILIIISIFFLGFTGWSQTDIQLSQLDYNRLLYNPAANSQSNFIRASLLARQQWTGFNDAPSTQALMVSNYFDQFKIGLALTAINDKVGVESNQNIKMHFTYHAWLSKDAYLSFGLGAGIMAHNIDDSKIIFETEEPDREGYFTGSKVKPDFDFGMEFNTRFLKIGLSSTHLTTSINNATHYKTPRHYYLYGKYDFVLTHEVTVAPMFMYSKSERISMFEIGALADYKDFLSGGISYRINESLVLQAKINITNNLAFGYAYDIALGDVSRLGKGSHEVMLSTRFGKRQTYRKSPRFFD